MASSREADSVSIWANMKISFGLMINCRNDELLCFENILSKGLESFHSEMVEELCLCLICVRIEFKDFLNQSGQNIMLTEY